MDLRITKKRVNDHLSYDWWKYLGILLVVVLVWNLIFTMSAPRLHKSKNMHIVFMTDYFNSSDTNAFNFLNTNLKKYLDEPYSDIERGGYEEVNINYPMISADNAEESTKFNTWLQVSDGDFYAFSYSDEAKSNKFGAFIDNYYFISINQLIEEALVYSTQIYTDINLYSKDNPKIKAKDLQKEFEKDKITKENVALQTAKLQQYIVEYPELFYNYQRNSTVLELNKDNPRNIEGLEIEESKIWGLDISKLNNSKNEEKNGFLTAIKADDSQDTIKVAMAVTRFKKENMPFYYNNIAVINFFIEAYHLGTVS